MAKIIPEVSLISAQFSQESPPAEIPTIITDEVRAAMDLCFISANEALLAGNPPVGAALIDHATGNIFRAKTEDKTTKHILAHAELKVYDKVAHLVGDDLSNMTLVSTAQPCSTCTPPYAEGKIQEIVYAAPRPLIRAICGIMRTRKINLPELIEDGNTNTTVTEGLMAVEALELFVKYAKQQKRTRTQIHRDLLAMEELGISHLRKMLDANQ